MAFEEALDRAEAKDQALLVAQNGAHFIDRPVTLGTESRKDRVLVGVDVMGSLVSAHGFRSGVPLLALQRAPAADARRAYRKTLARGTMRQPFGDRGQNPSTKIQRKRSCHPCWPPPSRKLESLHSRFGNPSRFNPDESGSSFANTRPFLVKEQAFLVPKKSIFNKIVGDSSFELDVAAFLDGCPDIISFVKNSQSTSFRIEYQNADGSIANYIPDFIVKETENIVWVIETKGREDLDDPLKWERLKQWCRDASIHDEEGRAFSPLFVRKEDWERYQPALFQDLVAAHR